MDVGAAVTREDVARYPKAAGVAVVVEGNRLPAPASTHLNWETYDAPGRSRASMRPLLDPRILGWSPRAVSVTLKAVGISATESWNNNDN